MAGCFALICAYRYISPLLLFPALTWYSHEDNSIMYFQRDSSMEQLSS